MVESPETELKQTLNAQRPTFNIELQALNQIKKPEGRIKKTIERSVFRL